jgi:hypothetical protein
MNGEQNFEISLTSHIRDHCFFRDNMSSHKATTEGNSPPASPPLSPQTTRSERRRSSNKKQRSREKLQDKIDNTKLVPEKSTSPEKPPPHSAFQSKDPPINQIEGNMEKRLRVVKELFESEKAHVHALDIVVERYLRPLMMSNLLPPSTVRAIFSNLELIRNWNQTFLAALEAHLECGDTFGDLFMEMVSHPGH